MKSQMRIMLFILFGIIQTINCFCQVTGNAFLSGQTDHSGIKVKFIPNSGTAILDSTVTNSNGQYSINLIGGLYQVLFSKSNYQDLYYNNGNTLAIATNTVLTDITLQVGNAIYISGNVSGIWYGTNIYIVNGEIIIPNGSNLTIQPGTQIKFNGNYSITGNGALLANGTASNPIKFTSNLSSPLVGDWNKIVIANSSSIIDNCIIEYCKTPISISGYSPKIMNTEIRLFSGDGIYCTNGTPIISKNSIHDFGGISGIRIVGSCQNTIIECNKIYNGNLYGIYTHGGIIRNNEIYNITDRGIFVTAQGMPLITNNSIHDCSFGIMVGNSSSSIPNPIITNNTIYSNTNAGINFKDLNADGTVINNIIANNGYGISEELSGSNTPSNISYNLLWNNSNGNLKDVQIVGIGQLVTTNSNGDQIDSYYNLFQDPLFINNIPPITNNNSPCINAGNATYSNNIGFDTTYSCYQQNSITLIEKSNFSIESFPNPFSQSFDLNVVIPFDTNVKIELFDMLGRFQSQILNEFKVNGKYCIHYSGINLRSGLYFIRLTTSNYTSIQNVIIKK